MKKTFIEVFKTMSPFVGIINIEGGDLVLYNGVPHAYTDIWDESLININIIKTDDLPCVDNNIVFLTKGLNIDDFTWYKTTVSSFDYDTVSDVMITAHDMFNEFCKTSEDMMNRYMLKHDFETYLNKLDELLEPYTDDETLVKWIKNDEICSFIMTVKSLREIITNIIIAVNDGDIDTQNSLQASINATTVYVYETAQHIIKDYIGTEHELILLELAKHMFIMKKVKVDGMKMGTMEATRDDKLFQTSQKLINEFITYTSQEYPNDKDVENFIKILTTRQINLTKSMIQKIDDLSLACDYSQHKLKLMEKIPDINRFDFMFNL